MKLTTEQAAAVEHDGGHAYIMAGPGSGKTTVLVHRALHSLRRHEGPKRILAVTFTTKACREMRERLETLGGEVDRVDVNTLHGFAHFLIREAGNSVEVEETETDKLNVALMQAALAASGHNADLEMQLLDRYRYRLRDLPLDPSRWAATWDQAPAPAAHIEEALRLFLELKLAHGVFTFDELVPFASYLVDCHAATQRWLQRRYAEVLVDELQDTSPEQWYLIRQLAEWAQVFAVGDHRQSIYRFRGADPENARNFDIRFPGARRYDLFINHRSRQSIVSFANAVLTYMDEPHVQPAPGAALGNPVWCYDVEIPRRGEHPTGQEYEKAIAWASADLAHRLMAQGVAPEDLLLLAHKNDTVLAAVNLLRAWGYTVRVLKAGQEVEEGGIRVGTVHSAKGLEAPVVLIMGADSRGFSDYKCTRSEREERRRLFFVAATRAIRELILVSGNAPGIRWPLRMELPCQPCTFSALPPGFAE